MFKWLGIGLLVFAIVGAAGWKVLGPKLSFNKPPAWKTEAITSGDIVVTVTATGTVGPLRTVLIGSQISGKVKDVFKYANDPVKKGEVLAVLDTDLLESEKRSAEVRLSQARAALTMLQVQRENIALDKLRLKADLERKTISVEKARGTMELAAKNRQRSQDLQAVNATSQTELDIRVLEEANTQRDLELMKIALGQAEVDQKQLEADGRQLDAKEEQAKADIQQADAVLARTVTNLAYATILSPIDGVVLQHLVEPGMTVAASFQTPNMFKVASDLSQVRIDAQLDEADIGKIRMGQEVTFDVDAYRNETFTGKVALVKLQSEQKGSLVTYPVLVEAKNGPDKEHPHGKLLPGMTAGLRFVVDKRPGAALLPAAALRFIPPVGSAPPKNTTRETGEKKAGTRGTVFIVNAEGQLESRAVRVGDNDGDSYELLEGEVKEGDQVVVGVK